MKPKIWFIAKIEDGKVKQIKGIYEKYEDALEAYEKRTHTHNMFICSTVYG